MPSPINTWEYLVRSVTRDMAGDVETKMNEFGLLGWELVGVFVNRGIEHYHFKRPGPRIEQSDAT